MYIIHSCIFTIINHIMWRSEDGCYGDYSGCHGITGNTMLQCTPNSHVRHSKAQSFKYNSSLAKTMIIPPLNYEIPNISPWYAHDCRPNPMICTYMYTWFPWDSPLVIFFSGTKAAIAAINRAAGDHSSCPRANRSAIPWTFHRFGSQGLAQLGSWIFTTSVDTSIWCFFFFFWWWKLGKSWTAKKLDGESSFFDNTCPSDAYTYDEVAQETALAGSRAIFPAHHD